MNLVESTRHTIMKPIETAQLPALQASGQSFSASIHEAWGVWMRLMQEDYLKAAFTKHEDAMAFAAKHARGGHRGEIRRMWVLVNETQGEAYALHGGGARPLEAVDLDFGHHLRMKRLRGEVLARLSDEELAAIGLKRSQ